MPCVFIETSRIKDVLFALPELPPHQWLISGLECYDYHGWDGCEKWAEQELFLSSEQLRHDAALRDMQIIWGVFSAIPVEFSKAAVGHSPLPEVETTRYMADQIVPQHPLALLELYFADSSYVLVSARDASLLAPLYQLPYPVRDEEADNRKTNAQLRRIQDLLRQAVPDVTPDAANNVQWTIWHKLFRDGQDVSPAALQKAVAEVYHALSVSGGARTEYTRWDPYLQM